MFSGQPSYTYRIPIDFVKSRKPTFIYTFTDLGLLSLGDFFRDDSKADLHAFLIPFGEHSYHISPYLICVQTGVEKEQWSFTDWDLLLLDVYVFSGSFSKYFSIPCMPSNFSEYHDRRFGSVLNPEEVNNFYVATGIDSTNAVQTPTPGMSPAGSFPLSQSPGHTLVGTPTGFGNRPVSPTRPHPERMPDGPPLTRTLDPVGDQVNLVESCRLWSSISVTISCLVSDIFSSCSPMIHPLFIWLPGQNKPISQTSRFWIRLQLVTGIVSFMHSGSVCPPDPHKIPSSVVKRIESLVFLEYRTLPEIYHIRFSASDSAEYPGSAEFLILSNQDVGSREHWSGF